MHRHEFLGPLPAPTLGLSVSHHRRDPPYPHPSLGRGVEVMRGAISVAITLSTILVVDGFIQPKLGRGVTLVSSRKSLCPSGIRPLIQTARPIKWRQENGPYGRGLCTCLMAADRKDDKVRFGFPKMLRRIVPFFAVRFRPVAAEVHRKGIFHLTRPIPANQGCRPKPLRGPNWKRGGRGARPGCQEGTWG